MYSKIFVGILVWIMSVTAYAAEGNVLEPKQMIWPFDGIFGTVDREAAQRGAQVYMEVCSVCHALNRVYYRNLKDIGFSEAEIKEIAKNHEVSDGPNDAGEMFMRPGIPSDRFVPPYPNEQASRAANNGAYPLDLSLIVKARQDGANYVYSILTGYQEAPKGEHIADNLHYNPYFEGHAIAMSAPLSKGQVQFSDGTDSSVEQMAHDVVVFLQWAAEPEMEHRKSMGFKVMMFLTIFTILFYIAKKKLWKDVK